MEVKEEFQAKPGRKGGALENFYSWAEDGAGQGKNREPPAGRSLLQRAGSGIFAVASGLLSSCGEQAPEHRCPGFAPLGPSCPMA